MRYVFSLLALFLCIQTIHAQEKYDYRCLYNLKCQPDSTDKEKITKAEMILFINSENQQSLFEPVKQFKYDSAVYANPANAGTFFGDSQHALVFRGSPSYAIYKKADKLITDDYVHYDFYAYEEDKTDIKWTILSDTLQINNILCQKAECNFGNRHWIVWFAPSIPINDGPYKFCGLPGLIVKVNDSKNYYNFSLISLEHYSTIIHKQENAPPLKVTKAAFFKALNYYFNYPFESAQVGPHAIHFISGQAEIKKYIEGLAAKGNNWIENYRKGKKK